MWNTYVQAILQYAEKSRKKNISAKLVDVNEEGENSVMYVIDSIIYLIDETSQHVVALKILAESLGKGQQSLCYLYDEYSVSVHVVHLSMFHFNVSNNALYYILCVAHGED